MSWVRFSDDRGRPWEINQFGLYLLVRQFLHSHLMMVHSNTVTERRLAYPDLVTVDVDFRAVRAGKDNQAPRMYDELARVSMSDGETAMQQIVDVRRNTDFNTNQFRERAQAASDRTMRNIDSAVSFGETAVTVARWVRNISATVLVTGATFLSGGTALAVLGAGSGLKGVSTYQDSGNMGAALIDATGTFVVGAIPIPMRVPASEQAARGTVSLLRRTGGQSTRSMMATIFQPTREEAAVLVVGSSINVGVEISKGMVEGRSMEQTVRRAGANLAVDLVSGGVLGPALDRRCLSIGTRVAIGAGTSIAGNQAVDYAGTLGEVTRAPEELRNIADAPADVTDNEQFIRENVFRPV